MKALGMRMRKLVLGLSLAQILPEKINKMLSPNNPGFIDVNRTVYQFIKLDKRKTLRPCSIDIALNCFFTVCMGVSDQSESVSLNKYVITKSLYHF